MAKIKKYCKEYIVTKLLRKLEDGGSRRHASSSNRDPINKSSRPPHDHQDDREIDVDVSRDKQWEGVHSDDDDGSDHQASPEGSSSSRRSVSEAVTDPRVRFRQDVNGKNYRAPSLPSSPSEPTPLTSVSMVSVGRISR